MFEEDESNVIKTEEFEEFKKLAIQKKEKFAALNSLKQLIMEVFFNCVCIEIIILILKKFVNS